MTIQINTNARVDVLNVGQEKTPVICIDNFLLSTAFMQKNAAEVAHFYKEPKSSYPGLRAQLPQEYLDVLSPLVAQPIRQIFRIPERYQHFIARSDYSLVTSPPETLRPAQKIPHADSSRIGDFAILLYVNEGDFGGTSFYRHKSTGIELLTDKYEQTYWASVNTFIHEYAQQELGFINGTDKYYERIGGVSYKPNRLVIYPTALLHSGDLTHACIDSNPSTGRLTINVMMVFA